MPSKSDVLILPSGAGVLEHALASAARLIETTETLVGVACLIIDCSDFCSAPPTRAATSSALVEL